MTALVRREKTKSNLTTVLLDLDGTLLPMNQETFTKAYFGALSQKAAEEGYDHKTFISAVWTAIKVMMKNDGRAKNIEVFWQSFQEALGEEALRLNTFFDAFYENEFRHLQAETAENLLAKPLIALLKQRGYTIALATNPVFPQAANRTRLDWVGLKEEDFSYVTCYENSRFCKPSRGYYADILEQLGKTAGETIMVGNDMGEDLAAAKLGMDIFMVTDCLVGGENTDQTVKKGTFRELLNFFTEAAS